MSKKFLVIGSACVGALLLCGTAASASPITVFSTFHFLDNRSANSINITPGVFQTFGAEAGAQDGNDAGTTATATQGSLVGITLNYTPFDILPHHFVRSRPAANTPNGQWGLSFTNGADNATGATPSIAGATLVPFISAMSISGSTLSWTAPAGTFDAQRITIRDTTDLIGHGGAGGGGVANAIYSNDLGVGTTSFDISTALVLDPTKLYSIELDLRQLRDSNNPNSLGNTLSQSRSFFDFTVLPSGAPDDVFLPTVDTSNASQPVYHFTEIPTIAGQTLFIDPLVAIGYDYEIGAGDPNFASVTLPTGIGDNMFELLLWDGSAWVFADNLTGGIEYSFGAGGVDLFRILGIETSANVDPNSATAFITGLTFVSDGTFSGTMTPLTAQTPIPATLPLFASGLGGLGLLGWRRRRKKTAAVTAA